MYSNFHSHTTYCDGKNTCEEMVIAAIEKGFVALGFSGHAHTSYSDYEMTLDGTAKYINEVRALREKYAGRLEIFCGIEQDFLSDGVTDSYDFVIGSTHSVTIENHECVVDWTAEKLRGYVEQYCNGDALAFAEAYFRREANIAAQTKCDIVGHFDLVTKFNEGGRFFDDTHPRFRDAAIAAMEEILKTCNLFEVNTGAMYNYGNANPYPTPWLLRELLARGGEVILSSDSHDTASLGYKFPELEELLRTIGFKYRKTLTSGGFVDIKL